MVMLRCSSETIILILKSSSDTSKLLFMSLSKSEPSEELAESCVPWQFMLLVSLPAALLIQDA